MKFGSESFKNAFSRGEFVVVHAENVFAEIGKEKWSTIGFFIPAEGGMMYIDNMVIPSGSKNTVFLDAFSLPPTTNTGASAYTKTTRSFFSIDDLSNSDNISDFGPDLELYNQLWQTIWYQH